MDQLIALIVGLISSGLVEGAKKVQSIPVNEGQVLRLRMVLGALVLGGNMLGAYLNGSLTDFAASEDVSLLVNSATSWVVGHLVYKFGIKPLS